MIRLTRIYEEEYNFRVQEGEEKNELSLPIAEGGSGSAFEMKHADAEKRLLRWMRFFSNLLQVFVRARSAHQFNRLPDTSHQSFLCQHHLHLTLIQVSVESNCLVELWETLQPSNRTESLQLYWQSGSQRFQLCRGYSLSNLRFQ